MDEQTAEQVIDTWNIHNRINKYLLDAIAPAALGDVSASKGRNVGEQFAHIHNVRLMWLKSAAPDLLEGPDIQEKPEKIEKEQSTDKPLLLHSLDLSGLAIAELLQRGIENGKIKGFKPHPLAFLGYLISHESYHRAEIGIILTQAGHPLDKKVSYGLWEWGVR
jgi:uncharacterized damage-inducible protein DinB